MEAFKQERNWGEHWGQVILHYRKPHTSYVPVRHDTVHLENVSGYNQVCSCPSHYASRLSQKIENCNEVCQE